MRYHFRQCLFITMIIPFEKIPQLTFQYFSCRWFQRRKISIDILTSNLIKGVFRLLLKMLSEDSCSYQQYWVDICLLYLLWIYQGVHHLILMPFLTLNSCLQESPSGKFKRRRYWLWNYCLMNNYNLISVWIQYISYLFCVAYFFRLCVDSLFQKVDT